MTSAGGTLGEKRAPLTPFPKGRIGAPCSIHSALEEKQGTTKALRYVRYFSLSHSFSTGINKPIQLQTEQVKLARKRTQRKTASELKTKHTLNSKVQKMASQSNVTISTSLSSGLVFLGAIDFYRFLLVCKCVHFLNLFPRSVCWSSCGKVKFFHPFSSTSPKPFYPFARRTHPSWKRVPKKVLDFSSRYSLGKTTP